MRTTRREFLRTVGIGIVAATTTKLGLARDTAPDLGHAIELARGKCPGCSISHEHFDGLTELPPKMFWMGHGAERGLDIAGNDGMISATWCPVITTMSPDEYYWRLKLAEYKQGDLIVMPTFSFDKNGEPLSRRRERKGERPIPLSNPLAIRGLVDNISCCYKAAGRDNRYMILVTFSRRPCEVGIIVHRMPLYRYLGHVA